MTKLDIQRSRAKLFTHGGSQAVRLPKAFRFEGSEVMVHREGDKVILEPVKKHRLDTPEERAAFWARIDEACDEPFPEREEFGPLREIDLDA
jgi:antitoxin VapB